MPQEPVLRFFGGVTTDTYTEKQIPNLEIEEVKLNELENSRPLKKNLSDPLTDASLLLVAGVYYIFGGIEKPKSIQLYQHQSIDGPLEHEKQLPHPRVCGVALQSGKRYVYLIGGSLSGNTMDRLDLETMEIITLAPMIHTREKFAAIIIKEEGFKNIIVVGGRCPVSGKVHDSIEIYDTLFDRWYLMPVTLSQPKYDIHISLNNSLNLVVVGGIDQYYHSLQEIEILNLTMDSNDVITPDVKLFPTGIHFGASYHDNFRNVLYLSGGINLRTKSLSDEIIELSTNNFTFIRLDPMQQPRHRHCVVLERNYIKNIKDQISVEENKQE